MLQDEAPCTACYGCVPDGTRTRVYTDEARLSRESTLRGDRLLRPWMTRSVPSLLLSHSLVQHVCAVRLSWLESASRET